MPNVREITEKDLEEFEREQTPLGIVDLESVLYINPALAKLLGVNDRSVIVGKSPFDYISPEYRRIANERIKAVIEGKREPILIEKLRKMDGSYIVVRVEGEPAVFKGRSVELLRIFPKRDTILSAPFPKFLDYLKKFSSILMEDTELSYEDLSKFIFEEAQKIIPDLWMCVALRKEDKVKVIFGKVNGKDITGMEISSEGDCVLLRSVSGEREGLYLPDIKRFCRRDNCRVLKFLRDSDPVSYFGFPLIVEGKVISVVAFLKKGYDSMTPEVLDLLKIVGAQMSIGLRVFRYVEKAVSQAKMYEDMAMRDPLTGAMTRRYFLKWLERKKEEIGCVLVFMDVDCLKKINDQFGHKVGDEVLRVFSKTVLSVIRESDVFVRWGGDEFLLIISGGDEKTADIVLSRIRKSIPVIEKLNCSPTFSAGIVAVDSLWDVEKALERADRMLYFEKNEKRCDFWEISEDS